MKIHEVLSPPERVERRCRPLMFLAWGQVSGRSADIAAALDGTARCYYPARLRDPRLVLLRYAVSAVATVAALMRHRPRALVVTNPPVFPGLIALAYARLVGAAVALDSHPAAFGRKDNRVAQRLIRVHAWMVRRSAVTLVTVDELGDVVRAWGGRALVLHEAPTPFRPAAPRSCRARLRVLFVGIFAKDEPVDAVVEAAKLVPETDISITGDLGRCRDGLRERAPENVTFVGFLDQPRYRLAIEEADVVLALTTEPTSVMRAAYEAVYAERPLILSDWPALRELFPEALAVSNTADDIARGIREAAANHAAMLAVAPAARERQVLRWSEQLNALRNGLGIEHA